VKIVLGKKNMVFGGFLHIMFIEIRVSWSHEVLKPMAKPNCQKYFTL
jgi:hypothetical protein